MTKCRYKKFIKVDIHIIYSFITMNNIDNISGELNQRRLHVCKRNVTSIILIYTTYLCYFKMVEICFPFLDNLTPSILLISQHSLYSTSTFLSFQNLLCFHLMQRGQTFRSSKTQHFFILYFSSTNKLQNSLPLFSYDITRSYLQVFWEINSSSWVFFGFHKQFISVLGICIAQLIISICQCIAWSTLFHNCLAYYLTCYKWIQNQLNFSLIINFDICDTVVQKTQIL